jgi:hypothetical protein
LPKSFALRCSCTRLAVPSYSYSTSMPSNGRIRHTVIMRMWTEVHAHMDLR